MNNPIQQLKNSNTNNSLSENNVNDFLNKELTNHITEPWVKLNKTNKLQRFNEYAKVYAEEHQVNEEDLYSFLSYSLEHKKLLKSSEVNYDVNEQKIISIPNLTFVSKTRKFTLKRPEKRQSTLKSLSCKKKQNGSKKTKEKDEK